MLQAAYIRENKDVILERMKKRKLDAGEVIGLAIDLDEKRKKVQTELDNTLSESNKIAREIGELYKAGNRDEAEKMKAKSGELKQLSQQLKQSLQDAESKLQDTLYNIPNVPHELVKKGDSDADNEIIEERGEKPKFDFKPLPHWELAEKYNIIDFNLGAKITGAGFPVYKGKGAKLQRALISFFLDNATGEGYEEVIPPLLVNEASGLATGQLPDKEGQMYELKEDKLFLIPTAEVPITNLYRDVILKADDFPVKNTGFTPCFRREAGSYGKHVRGLNRLHQFDKVEIVQIQHPDKSYDTLDEMVNYVKSLLDKLNLPFRVARLCGGDLGFTAALTYDMEVYSSAQERWLEVSSVSNFESYQANRLKLRFKDKDGKTRLAHTLNGSALALPRIMAAVIENNQTENAIRIPEALVPYTGFESIE